MFIEYNKFTILTYFITGTTISFVGRRWTYGMLILLLSASILLQRQVLSNSSLLKYQNITQIIPVFLFFFLILTSLYVLSKSSVTGKQKLLSIIFLILSLGHSIAKKHFKDKPIFNTAISRYTSCLLFMVVLWTTAFIPDNQAILRMKQDEVKDKIRRL